MTQKSDTSLPRECFKYSTGVQRINNEMGGYKPETNSVIKGMIYGKQTGFLIEGAMYPYKVVTTPEILWATNTMKSVFIEGIKRFPLEIIFGHKETLIDTFNRLSDRIMNEHILKDEFLSVFGRELQFLIFNFLINLNIPEEKAIKTADTLTHLIEYDNAYRLRLVDILSETNQYLLSTKPIRELWRLTRIVKKRQGGALANKLNRFAFLIIGICLIPKYRKAFKKAVQAVDFWNLQYDDCDLYWTAVRQDYLFWGKTKADRKQFVDNKGWDYPTNLWENV